MGGNGGGGGGGKRKREIVPCEELLIKTQLASPVDDIGYLVNLGDYLALQISGDGKSCVAISKGKIVGAIFDVKLNQLINCIKAGTVFHAYVRSISGGKCAVTIKHY